MCVCVCVWGGGGGGGRGGGGGGGGGGGEGGRGRGGGRSITSLVPRFYTVFICHILCCVRLGNKPRVGQPPVLLYIVYKLHRTSEDLPPGKFFLNLMELVAIFTKNKVLLGSAPCL